jgi:hypothetical protein
MSSGTNQSTVLSDAEQRVITVKTEAGDIVKYSGNPAELPGARLETKKALLRAGAFTLLVKHNASRLKNGTVKVTLFSVRHGKHSRRQKNRPFFVRAAQARDSRD